MYRKGFQVENCIEILQCQLCLKSSIRDIRNPPSMPWLHSRLCVLWLEQNSNLLTTDTIISFDCTGNTNQCRLLDVHLHSSNGFRHRNPSQFAPVLHVLSNSTVTFSRYGKHLHGGEFNCSSDLADFDGENRHFADKSHDNLDVSSRCILSRRSLVVSMAQLARRWPD